MMPGGSQGSPGYRRVALPAGLTVGRYLALSAGPQVKGDAGIRAIGQLSYPRAAAFASPPASKAELAEISSSPKQALHPPGFQLQCTLPPEQIT